MSRFINPFTDMGFKKIFGQEINKDLLIDFLNDLLAGERTVADITFLDKELLPKDLEDRGVIYDIYCISDTGERFIVEMQNRFQLRFRERALYYMSRAISEQGERGVNWKFELVAVYGVFFMNFSLEGMDKMRSDVILSDRETGELFSDKMRMIFIQLPLFKKEEKECDNDFEKWIYVLKNMDTLKRMPFKAVKSVFEKLESIVDIAALSKEDRKKYDASIKVYRDNLAVYDGAIEEGWKKGWDEGKEAGIQAGREEGIMLTAKNMILNGIEPSVISKVTGLSIDQLSKLN